MSKKKKLERKGIIRRILGPSNQKEKSPQIIHQNQVKVRKSCLGLSLKKRAPGGRNVPPKRGGRTKYNTL